MTGSTSSRIAGTGAIGDSAAALPKSVNEGRSQRLVLMAAVVGLWMSLGWAFNLGAVAYLLSGIPLTIAFQLLVARRPIRALWLLDARPFHLDGRGRTVAVGLAVLPASATLLGITGGRVLDVAYGLVGVIGAVPAAYALRALDSTGRRGLVRSVLTAGIAGAALFLANHLLARGLAIEDPAGAIRGSVISFLLYVPMVFVIEEVFFRGALDPYARGPRLANDRTSAVYVSLLWGVWHLPLVIPAGGVAQLPVTMAFHLVIGLLLVSPWRRSGNLAVPGITHALIDAVRDGLAVI